MTPNESAFLAMVSMSEGTDRADNPYRVCFGFKHTILNLSDHPAITGEWHGEPLDNLGPQYAHRISTAAGRYQINKPTWVWLRTQISLPDFTGPNQDAAALQLIDDHHARTLIGDGEIEAAIGLCRGVWASLPGNDYGQPTNPLTTLIDFYKRAGGTCA